MLEKTLESPLDCKEIQPVHPRGDYVIVRRMVGRKVMTNLDSILKSRDITLPTKVRLVKAMVKEIQPVHPKGDQSWVFIGRTDVEAEDPILWSHDAKN